MACPFCEMDVKRVALTAATCVALRDAFPVNPGHTLVVPRRHFASWFDASPQERLALVEMVDRVKAALDQEFHSDGYNIGINVGTAAGQTVDHLHIHVIPRFGGDVDDPTGGVRFVIPERGNYRRPGFIPRARAKDDGGA